MIKIKQNKIILHAQTITNNLIYKRNAVRNYKPKKSWKNNTDERKSNLFLLAIMVFRIKNSSKIICFQDGEFF